MEKSLKDNGIVLERRQHSPYLSCRHAALLLNSLTLLVLSLIYILLFMVFTVVEENDLLV